MAKRFLDTNSILTDCTDISNVAISSKTLDELENIKSSSHKDNDIKYKARVAVRAIREQKPEIVVVQKSDYDKIEELGLEITNDNLIIASAWRYSQENPIVFVTNDILCGLIAEKYFGLNVENLKETNDNVYKGFRVVQPTDEELKLKNGDVYKGYKTIRGNSDIINKYMESIDYNDWSVNEYLIIENTDDNTSKEMRFDGEKFVNLKLPSSKFIKGKNSLQRCALDILMNPDITIASILGGYGSGKTFLSMQMALYNVVEKGNQAKILGVREVLGEGKEVGYLKGDFDSKTELFFLPLVQQLNGGEFELESLKQRGVIDTNIPFYMKGTTYNNTIIVVDEAEDLSEKQIRLIGTRLGENSKIYLAGDYKQSVVNTGTNNALIKMCNQFKGNKNFGCIYLGEDVRSETSKLFAEIFDN